MDEIKSDDLSGKDKGKKISDSDMEKLLNEALGHGKLKKAPNLRYLPNEQKEQIAKLAAAKAANMLVATYTALGIGGEFTMGVEEGFSGDKFKLHFKHYKKGDDDADFPKRP